MPVSVRITQRGFRGVRQMLRDIPPDPRRGNWAARGLLRAAFELQKLSVTKYILRGSGPGSPNIRRLPVDPNRITSRRGGAGIIGSIAVDRTELPRFAVSVGSQLVYAAVHEYGNATTPARPYLQPALDEVEERAPRYLMEEWDRDMRKHRGQDRP